MHRGWIAGARRRRLARSEVHGSGRASRRRSDRGDRRCMRSGSAVPRYRSLQLDDISELRSPCDPCCRTNRSAALAFSMARHTVSRMRRILLARHGETAWNVARRLQGHTDIPLNELGREQARALAARLAGAGLTAIWTSDLSRARETGEIIAAGLGLAAPMTDRELRERQYGIFEGLTRDECMARDRAAWDAWVWETGAPPGGEPGTEATARLARPPPRIADAEGGPVLVVSHGAVMRLYLMSVLGAPVPIVANATTYVVEHGPAGVGVGTLVDE